MTGLTDQAGARTAFTCDNRGQVLTRTDPLGKIATSTYDNDGRVIAMTDPRGFTTGYEDDAAGNLTRLTYPGNKTVTYTYDALNRLDTVTIDWCGSGKKNRNPASEIADAVKALTSLANMVQGRTFCPRNKTAFFLNGILFSLGEGLLMGDPFPRCNGEQ
ncbi:MAG: hypothetical protein BM485_02385 [Desulfobulbaceae bacterium DB1]|nr:MAG: hypothetical protein BM485_02385 [Desulfobulbaceae bacterium DB1]